MPNGTDASCAVRGERDYTNLILDYNSDICFLLSDVLIFNPQVAIEPF